MEKKTNKAKLEIFNFLRISALSQKKKKKWKQLCLYLQIKQIYAY